jgi:hypothetical protein
LRHDAGPTKSNAGIVVDAGQQRAEFGCDADAVLALENAGWITYLRNAPEAAKLLGPPGGLSNSVCKTISQRSANP